MKLLKALPLLLPLLCSSCADGQTMAMRMFPDFVKTGRASPAPVGVVGNTPSVEVNMASLNTFGKKYKYKPEDVDRALAASKALGAKDEKNLKPFPFMNQDSGAGEDNGEDSASSADGYAPPVMFGDTSPYAAQPIAAAPVGDVTPADMEDAPKVQKSAQAEDYAQYDRIIEPSAGNAPAPHIVINPQRYTDEDLLNQHLVQPTPQQILKTIEQVSAKAAKKVRKP